jgi:serine/threonine protein kinase
MTTRRGEPSAVPPVIDGFVDLEEIGRGGFGTVYRARQLDPARDVAIKVLPDVRADSDAYGRFTREFQALAAVGGHPSIATVHGCGVTADGSGYLALELLDGGSLGERVRAGGVPWADAASWGVQLAGALETAHRAGITHRDIKPENVLFGAQGAPQLVDFGIAGVPGAYRTATGSVTLTLAHAAPEVVAGGRGGVPADIYSLASTLYAALAGGAAFAADTDETLVPMLARIATAPVPDLRPRGVPDRVCAALERAMAKDPADRPASAEALGMSLQSALTGAGVRAPAPLLLLSPGVAAPFVISADAPAPGSSAGRERGPDPEGEHTLTGWVAPPAPTAASARDRHRSGLWAAAASLAAVLALLMVWRGFDTPAPAAAGSAPSPSAGSSSARPSSSATPTSAAPSASPTPTVRRSTSPSAGASYVLAVPRTRTAASTPRPAPARTSKASASPSATTTAAPSPTPTATPPVTSLRPLAPRRVRAGGGAAVRGEAGAPAQVAVRLSWVAARKGTAPSAYEVRVVPVGGPAGGTATLVATVTTTAAVVRVPAPAAGVRYRWQVRAVLATEGSGWAPARAAVPQLVGRNAAPARTALRALGLVSSTYRVAVDAAVPAGRVVEQSLPRGRLVPVGSTIALGIGTAL